MNHFFVSKKSGNHVPSSTTTLADEEGTEFHAPEAKKQKIPQK
jgi:hypothetical protein